MLLIQFPKLFKYTLSLELGESKLSSFINLIIKIMNLGNSQQDKTEGKKFFGRLRKNKEDTVVNNNDDYNIFHSIKIKKLTISCEFF